MTPLSEQATQTIRHPVEGPMPVQESNATRGDWLVLLFWLTCFALMWSAGLLGWFLR
jgi:hypothetical protein